MSNPKDNSDQLAYWNGPSGERWAEQQETLDASLRPMAEAALKVAAPKAGDHVLDIGCGTGATSLMLGDMVGPSGRVTGIDISKPMLARAIARADELKATNVTFIEADAATHEFSSQWFDVLFSRFGVMFFVDPLAAFQNLHHAAKKGARLGFVCWRPLRENPFALVPMAAALKHLPPQPPADPNQPGPFGFGDKDRTARILAEAGFSGVSITPFDSTMVMARKPETAANEAVYMGMASRLLKDATKEVKERVIAELTETYRLYLTPDGVTFPAHCWIVSATA